MDNDSSKLGPPNLNVPQGFILGSWPTQIIIIIGTINSNNSNNNRNKNEKVDLLQHLYNIMSKQSSMRLSASLSVMHTIQYNVFSPHIHF